MAFYTTPNYGNFMENKKSALILKKLAGLEVRIKINNGIS